MEKAQKQSIKKAASWDELVAILCALENADFSAREIELIARNVERLRDGSDLKVALLANHTIDLLPGYLSALHALDNVKVESYVAPYNQYFQEFLTDSSGLLAFDADVIYLDLSIPSLSPKINHQFLQLDTEQKNQELDRVVDTHQQLASLSKQKTNATLLVSNFVQPSYAKAGIADFQLGMGEVEWYARLNLKLIELFRDDARTFIVDKNNVLSRHGKLASTSVKMYYIAKMELNESALSELSLELIRYFKAIKGLTKKCLVLDLDNTLWGGVVGEDGVAGLKIGKGYPEGEVFYDLQSFYQTLKQRGIILAIASKNNSEDAEEVFREKTDMPLSLDDFAVQKISWDTKNKSIEAIASILNIGKDSIVFVDDNPVERNLVLNALPDVAVPDLPTDPTGYLPTLLKKDYFEKLFLTEEDAGKLEQYQQNALRDASKNDIADIDDFLGNLGTTLTVLTADKKNLPRAHQLFTKTNQFNATTQRYSTGQVEQFIEEQQWDLTLFAVADNYGDMGIVGLVLLEVRKTEVRIDSFILSCRAMGRGIETAIMNVMKKRYLLEGGKNKMSARYIKTKKNIPVATFFESQGFSVDIAVKGDGEGYALSATEVDLLKCPEMEIIFGSEFGDE